MKAAIAGITRAVITVGLLGVSSYLWISGKPLPQGLELLTGLTVGSYFKELASVVSKK